MKTYSIITGVIAILLFAALFLYKAGSKSTLHDPAHDLIKRLEIAIICYRDKYGYYCLSDETEELYPESFGNSPYWDEIKKNDSIKKGDRYIVVDPYGNPIIYRCPGKINRSSFDLILKGPDAKPGTDDDVCYKGF